MKKSTEIALVAVILGSMFGLMFWSSLNEVPIVDEVPHVGAGYSSLLKQDGRLNPEHPPLVKYLAAVPLLFMHLQFPNTKAWNEDINGQWDFGAQLLFDGGNNAEQIIHWARLLPMMLTLLLGLYIYRFIKKYFNNKLAAFGALLLYAFSPTVLAHGHYVTTDIGAGFAFVFSFYYLLQYLKTPTRRNLVFAGLAFGLAQLLKFSAILLIPIFIVLVVIYFLTSLAGDWQKSDPKIRFKRFAARFGKYALNLVAIFAIGYVLVWAVYAYHTWHIPQDRQLRDTEAILQGSGIKPLAKLNIAIAKNNITRPMSWYALGILMASQRAAGGNTTYFLGQVNAFGWKYYFPIVYSIKETLPVLIMLFTALMGALTAGMLWLRYGKTKERFWELLAELRYHFPAVAILVGIAVYWLTAIISPLNIGVRHLFPAITLMYIGIAAWLFQKARFYFTDKQSANIKQIKIYSHFYPMFIVFLILWQIGTGLAAAPHFISYFNPLIGGSSEGYKYVTDSNLDWGQDLKSLSTFVKGNNIPQIYVDYFGWSRPQYKDYLDGRVIWYDKSKGPPPPGSWLAVSATFLQGSCRGDLPCNVSEDANTDQTWYNWLRPIKPYTVIGNSIFVYRF